MADKSLSPNDRYSQLNRTDLFLSNVFNRRAFPNNSGASFSNSVPVPLAQIPGCLNKLIITGGGYDTPFDFNFDNFDISVYNNAGNLISDDDICLEKQHGYKYIEYVENSLGIELPNLKISRVATVYQRLYTGELKDSLGKLSVSQTGEFTFVADVVQRINDAFVNNEITFKGGIFVSAIFSDDTFKSRPPDPDPNFYPKALRNDDIIHFMRGGPFTSIKAGPPTLNGRPPFILLTKAVSKYDSTAALITIGEGVETTQQTLEEGRFEVKNAVVIALDGFFSDALDNLKERFSRTPIDININPLPPPEEFNANPYANYVKLAETWTACRFGMEYYNTSPSEPITIILAPKSNFSNLPSITLQLTPLNFVNETVPFPFPGLGVSSITGLTSEAILIQKITPSPAYLDLVPVPPDLPQTPDLILDDLLLSFSNNSTVITLVSPLMGPLLAPDPYVYQPEDKYLQIVSPNVSSRTTVADQVVELLDIVEFDPTLEDQTIKFNINSAVYRTFVVGKGDAFTIHLTNLAGDLHPFFLRRYNAITLLHLNYFQ
jgi:hypothetical protein